MADLLADIICRFITLLLFIVGLFVWEKILNLSEFPPVVLFQGADFAARNAGVQDTMTEPCGRVAHGLLAIIRFSLERTCWLRLSLFLVRVMSLHSLKNFVPGIVSWLC